MIIADKKKKVSYYKLNKKVVFKKQNKNQNIFKEMIVAFIVVVFFVFLFSSSSQADISKQINYQGKLTDSTNSAVPDGSYDMIFKLYDADTSGTLLWTGTHTVANSNPATVTSGIFSVLLGSGTDNTLSLDFNSNSYYLQVEIYNSDTTTWETLTPRKQIGSTPSSFNSDRLDGLDSAESGADAHIVKTDSSGNLTVSGNAYFNGTTYYVNSTGTANLNGLTLAGNLNVNNNQFLVNTSTGFIGIGTDTPTTALDVNGTVNATAFVGDGSGLTNLPVGLDGVDGLDGATWYSGTDAPPLQNLGNTNDFYLNTSNYEVYKKNTVNFGVTDVFTGGTASASSVFSSPSYTADKAVDNSNVTSWYSNSTTNQWWKYDLGSGNEVAISKITILPHNDESMKDFRFEGSNDDLNWDVLLNDSLPATTLIQTFEFINETPYRYYRVYGINNQGGTTRIGFKEIEGFVFGSVDWASIGNIKGANGTDGIDGTDGTNGVDGTAGATWYSGTDAPPLQTFGNANDYYLNTSTYEVYEKNNPAFGLTNLLTGGTTSASSTFPGFTPDMAVDGSTSAGSTWYTNIGPPAWWQYDFGEGNEQVLSKFEILSSTTELKDFKIQASNNGVDFVDLYIGQYGSSGTFETFEFVNANLYRYYRIYVLSINGGSYISLRELRAYTLDSVDWQSIGNIKGADGTNGIDGSDSLWLDDGTDMYFTTGNVGIGDATPVALFTVGNG
ncbi:MAG: discoidin domain-containing protein, partial [Candidatus Moraniibacteriota bacterium]